MYNSLTPAGALALFLALNTAVQATPTLQTPADPLAGKTISEVRWEVQAFPGGEILQMNGTVEEVWDKLVAINPSYIKDWGIEDRTAPINDLEVDEFTISKRTDFTDAKLICSNYYASAAKIREGIR
ncbi:hypothetical protein B0I35DRAFT_404537 [Stachybotrys elegans]|uniref:Uncharacterized protein n=1 Tax=Stachybotrys elegans TaxID=80388 RepID=A0A8K0WYV9_9HYPO|nr:hypothetical protein B0I35DRAFT_404537 [Stachybotrys elegans]